MKIMDDQDRMFFTGTNRENIRSFSFGANRFTLRARQFCAYHPNLLPENFKKCLTVNSSNVKSPQAQGEFKSFCLTKIKKTKKADEFQTHRLSRCSKNHIIC